MQLVSGKSSQGPLENSFRNVFETMYPKILGYFLHKGLRRELAEEMAQDVFLSLHDVLKQQRTEPISEGYLLTMALNRFRNWLRSKNTVKRNAVMVPIAAVEGSGSGISGPAGENPFERMVEKETRQRVHRMIKTLPDRMRTCFLLCKIHGRDQDEVAHLLGIHPKTVRSQISQARQRMLEIWENGVDLD